MHSRTEAVALQRFVRELQLVVGDEPLLPFAQFRRSLLNALHYAPSALSEGGLRVTRQLLVDTAVRAEAIRDNPGQSQAKNFSSVGVIHFSSPFEVDRLEGT
jgi:hypothetical protein